MFIFLQILRKKLELNTNGYYTSYSNQKIGYGFSFAPRYRFKNQFSLNYRLNFNKTNNDQGSVDKINDDIILGQKDRKVMHHHYLVPIILTRILPSQYPIYITKE
jgi:hypothetical protein